VEVLEGTDEKAPGNAEIDGTALGSGGGCHEDGDRPRARARGLMEALGAAAEAQEAQVSAWSWRATNAREKVTAVKRCGFIKCIHMRALLAST